MKKIILEIDENGYLVDKNGGIIHNNFEDSIWKYEVLDENNSFTETIGPTVDELIKLKQAGYTAYEINQLRNEGLI